MTLTHPERVIDRESGLTKQRLADDYGKVASRMFAHIAHRPLMFVRCPAGTGAACFHQRNWNESLPSGIEPIEGRDGTLFTVRSEAGIRSLAQFGVLEVHAWNARVPRLEHPDQWVFDLDPGDGVDWRLVAETAFLIKERLGDYGLRSFVKTTGGKGLHIVAPLEPRMGWELGLRFSKAICQEIAAVRPHSLLTKAAKADRHGKIFLDYLRNGRGATAVAPYSPRARPGLPVSIPIPWDDLETVRGDSYHVEDADARIARSPWPSFHQLRQFPRMPEGSADKSPHSTTQRRSHHGKEAIR